MVAGTFKGFGGTSAGYELFIIPHDPRRGRRATSLRKLLWATFVLSCLFALPAPAQAGGDPEVGKSLFSGTTRFRNGGAACVACHAIAGLPGGGGTLGPDLTRTYSDYGEEAITPVLAEFPFPSMKPIYDAHPLTPEEQGHTKAFLRVSAEREPAGEKRGFLLFGIGGCLLVIGLAHVVWRKRLTEVRRPFLRRAAGPGGGGA